MKCPRCGGLTIGVTFFGGVIAPKHGNTMDGNASTVGLFQTRAS